MTKKSTGKNAQDIFQATAPSPKAKPMGRPPIHDERWTKATVILLDRQIVWLDRLSADIRSKTGAVVKRAELIRAAIDALRESKIDLTVAMSEATIKTIILGKMS